MFDLPTRCASPERCHGDPPTDVTLQRDNERLRRENERLRRRMVDLRAAARLAYRDALTGLRNRRYAERRLREELQRLTRQTGQQLAVLLIDVDHLKHTNDTLGHAAGDELLRRVAAFLERSVRKQDVCCRIGGDEFLLLLPDADAPRAAALLRRLRARLRESSEPLALSVGMATARPDDDVSSLLARADRAMYRDKGRRRRRAGNGAPSPHEHAPGRLGPPAHHDP